MDLQPVIEYCKSIGLPLDDGQISRFEQFGRALYELNRSVNLTRVPEEECPVRHFVESLLVSPLIPSGSTVLDIGSGAGFPAWPLACVRSDIRVTALDGTSKMLLVLRDQPLENLSVVNERAESWGVREEFDIVTGRAVAPLPAQLEISAAPLKVGGLLIPFRTPSERELFRDSDFAKLGLALSKVVDVTLPTTDVVRCFPIYEKTSRTPKRFPRSWAEIRKAPLGG
ncbi:MAG: 16S rRNA (guanine(527)-N(7))-methyltransferase RsmG [Armatimonadetes bacterium]|nr:16S rRNA (guanine(527)-N(7))-methyltransferase RsmG [Armatimonadota bacterium]